MIRVADMSLISIIVPIYNVESFLSQCIESILAQSYQNLEIILVDDGSTDNSGKICEEYAQKDSRIKVIHKPNGGLVSARNAGLDIATGEYIGFVDGDDWIEPQTYQTALELLQQHQVDLVKWGKTKVVQKTIIPIVVSYPAGAYRDDSKSTLLSQMIKGQGIDPNIVTCLFKSEIIKKYYLRTPIGVDIGEDVYFSTLYLLHAHSMYVDLGLHFYNYRQNPVSLTKHFTPTHLLKLENFIKYYSKLLLTTTSGSSYNQAFYYRINIMVFYALFVCADFRFRMIPDKIRMLKEFYRHLQPQFQVASNCNTISWIKRIPVILFYKNLFILALSLTYFLKILFQFCVKIKSYV